MKSKISSINQFKAKAKKKNLFVILTQIGLVVIFFGSWEIFTSIGLLNKFLVSSPSEISKLFYVYLQSGELFKHINISLYETIMGLTIGTLLGLIIATLLWWNKTIARILDPFLVILNALPKTALAPIIIVWAGAGTRGIIVIAISLSIVITILSAYNHFNNVDKGQIQMMQTLKASRWQIFRHLVLPSNTANILNIIKINIGMTWVGVIVGEFLVSRVGIGYLVVYGGQVFKLDLVMMGVLILCVLALLMYFTLNLIEKYYREKRYRKRKKNEEI